MCVNIYIYIRNVLHLLTDKVVYIIFAANDLQRLLSKIFFHGSFFFFFSFPNFFNIFGTAYESLGIFLGILRGIGDGEAEYQESVIPTN